MHQDLGFCAGLGRIAAIQAGQGCPDTRHGCSAFFIIFAGRQSGLGSGCSSRLHFCVIAALVGFTPTGGRGGGSHSNHNALYVACVTSCRYKWDTLPAAQRPERGLLGLRAGLNAFANLRPAIVPPQVSGVQ